jgi:hypothetical protein
VPLRLQGRFVLLRPLVGIASGVTGVEPGPFPSWGEPDRRPLPGRSALRGSGASGLGAAGSHDEIRGANGLAAQTALDIVSTPPATGILPLHFGTAVAHRQASEILTLGLVSGIILRIAR